LKQIKKELAFAGKGHNEIFEVINPVRHARNVIVVDVAHVPENGGT
jgi:hypothetical protein